MLAPRLLRLDSMAGVLNHLPDSGVIEWVVHPGMADESLIGRDDYRTARVKELESLTNPRASRLETPASESHQQIASA